MIFLATNPYTNKVIFGDETVIDLSADTVDPEHLAEGYTAHDKSGALITGTMTQTGGGIDTSDATATESMIVYPATAYVNGKKIEGSIQNALGTVFGEPSYGYQTISPPLGTPRIAITIPVSNDVIIRASQSNQIYTNAENFGDATAEDVASGKTFTSSAGLQVAGTKVDLDTSDATATASDILSGKTAYVDGNKITGTYEGGTSTDNCEAYHITSADDTINFSGTGTVKVWGYGYKSGGFSGTHYSFIGDGYYSGSWGTPTKTSASFSISSGKLSGLPSGLTSLDVLVTIGV